MPVVTADFTDGFDGFEPEVHHPGSGALRRDGGALRMDVHADVREWELQARRPGLRIRRGERYRVSVRMRANRERRAGLQLSRAVDDWMPVGLDARFRLTSAWQSRRFEFQADRDAPVARLNFVLGGPGAAGTVVWMDDVRLERCR